MTSDEKSRIYHVEAPRQEATIMNIEGGVSCSHALDGCMWEGETFELQSHLDSECSYHDNTLKILKYQKQKDDEVALLGATRTEGLVVDPQIKQQLLRMNELMGGGGYRGAVSRKLCRMCLKSFIYLALALVVGGVVIFVYHKVVATE